MYSSLTLPIRFILELCTTCHSVSKWNFNVTLTWIRSHVSVSSNMWQDVCARDATTQGVLLPGIHSLDFKTTLWCTSKPTTATKYLV